MPRNSKPVPTENPVTLRLRAGKEGRKRETERKRERKKERGRRAATTSWLRTCVSFLSLSLSLSVCMCVCVCVCMSVANAMKREKETLCNTCSAWCT